MIYFTQKCELNPIWCELRKLNLRSVFEYEKMKILQKALPAFCPILVSICDLEKSSYLPQCVSEIVLKLIKIRRDTFKKAPQRYSEDYYPYEKTGIFTEDPTQYYPLHPIMRYPKRYAVSGKVDDDHCDKNFPSHGSKAPNKTKRLKLQTMPRV